MVCNVENVQTYPLFLSGVHRVDDATDRAWYILQGLFIILMCILDRPYTKCCYQDFPTSSHLFFLESYFTFSAYRMP